MKNSVTISNKRSDEPVSVRTSAPASMLVRVLRTYQRFTSGRLSPCRFYPSCSSYAIEAIEGHGAVRGTGLALRRLARCRPLGPHGVDLVPVPKNARSPQQ